MKKGVMSEGMQIALGFIAVGIFVAVLWPVLTDVINDAVSKRPKLPSVSMHQIHEVQDKGFL